MTPEERRTISATGITAAVVADQAGVTLGWALLATGILLVVVSAVALAHIIGETRQDGDE